MAVLSLSNEPAQPKQVKPEDSLHIDGEMFMNNEPFFDYKRDYDPDGEKMWIQAVGAVEIAKKMIGSDDEALLKEAKEEHLKFETSSKAHEFWGAIINEIQYPLKERMEKKLKRERTKFPRHYRLDD